MSRSREQIRYWLSQLDGYAPPNFDNLSTEEIERLQLYRIIANQIPQRVFLKDLNSSYVWTNRRFADDANVDTPAELVGKTDLDMPWTNEQSESYTADDQMVIQTGQPKINIIELQTRSDGSHAWLHTNKVPVFSKDGEVIGVIGTYEDITERAQAEIALRRYQQMVESIFNHIPVAIFWKDLDLRYLGCNANFATDAGVASPDDIVGKTDDDLPWSTEHSDLFQADDRAVMESGEPKLNYIEKQLQANGKVAWLQTNKVPLFDASNKVIGVLGTYQNITEQIEARESLRRARLAALEDRQRLARELHDAVSQTLWTASLMADLLPEVWDNDREEGEQNLEKLKRLTKGALSEMRMLLLELRPSALVETDLSELLDRLAEAIMSRKRLDISVHAESVVNLIPDVKIGLYRIAQEALNNVARHSKATHAEIKLTEVDGVIELVVSDDGRGFDVDNPAPNRMGVGIMQERAADIQAKIMLESTLGAGTTITVRCYSQHARRQNHE